MLKVFLRPSPQNRHLGDVQRPILHLRVGVPNSVSYVFLCILSILHFGMVPPRKVTLKGWWYWKMLEGWSTRDSRQQVATSPWVTFLAMSPCVRMVWASATPSFLSDSAWGDSWAQLRRASKRHANPHNCVMDVNKYLRNIYPNI